MAPTSSIDAGTLDDLAVVLAGRAAARRADVDMATVSALNLKQLQEAARVLGLSGYSRLKKEALALAVWESWQAVASNGSVQNGHATIASKSGGEGKGTGQGKGQGMTNGAGVTHASPAGRPGDGVTADGGVRSGETRDEGDAGNAVAPVAHKYELAQSSAAPAREVPRDIPWGYGLDRVTAMPVDPDRLFVYWEVLEDSIARARAALGPRGEGAWLNLRIYDVTGRIFDGGNAHSAFDQGLDRNARQWFFTVGKPTAEVVVELGMCAADGGFQKIARSGRVEFPRRDPAPWTEPEWLTVRAAGSEVVRTWLPHPAHGGGVPGPVPAEGAGGPGAAGVAGAAGATADDGGPSLVWNVGVEAAGEERIVERTEWEEIRTDGVTEAHRRVTWEEQSTITSWQEGPFSYPVEVPEPVLESFVGRTRVFRSGARTRIVYGPWQVVIRGIGASKAASVISRWEVYRSWGEQKGTEVVGFAERAIFAGERGPGGASERVLAGASERSWRGASELRLGGSSEVFYLGASERRMMGASELQYAGSSERVLRGASERRLAGASEWRYAGASERRLGGGSEERLGGGSEHRFLGASENLTGNRTTAPAPAPEQGWPDAAQIGGGGRGTSGGRASGD